MITDKPVHTRMKRERAAILTNKNNKLIVATGSDVGLPDLRSGCAVEILGFGVQSNKNGSLQGASSDL